MMNCWAGCGKPGILRKTSGEKQKAATAVIRTKSEKILQKSVDKRDAAGYNTIGKTKKNGGIRSHLQQSVKRSTGKQMRFGRIAYVCGCR